MQVPSFQYGNLLSFFRDFTTYIFVPKGIGPEMTHVIVDYCHESRVKTSLPEDELYLVNNFVESDAHACLGKFAKARRVSTSDHNLIIFKLFICSIFFEFDFCLIGKRRHGSRTDVKNAYTKIAVAICINSSNHKLY